VSGRWLCHEQPDLLVHEATVVATRPGAVVLDCTAFHPGGGGQPSDVGTLAHRDGIAAVTGVSVEDGVWWHLLDTEAPVACPSVVEVAVDGARRDLVAQLHTDAHVLNALVFERFAGALVTGAQIGVDGTARIDFDLPEVANDDVRALEPAANDVIRQGLEVRGSWIDAAEAARTPGLVRSLSVAPPPSDDGHLRVVEIVGLDRQACGGTHLSSTAGSRPLRITKVENKGRRNRRIRYALDPADPPR
jgi:misacylated tRNA(Ala) deacylase